MKHLSKCGLISWLLLATILATIYSLQAYLIYRYHLLVGHNIGLIWVGVIGVILLFCRLIIAVYGVIAFYRYGSRALTGNETTFTRQILCQVCLILLDAMMMIAFIVIQAIISRNYFVAIESPLMPLVSIIFWALLAMSWVSICLGTLSNDFVPFFYGIIRKDHIQV